jgi:hypothetical protein
MEGDAMGEVVGFPNWPVVQHGDVAACEWAGGYPPELVRVVEIGAAKRFVVVDIARILGLRVTRSLLAKIGEDRPVLVAGPRGALEEISTLSAVGIGKLVSRCHSPKARQFARWLRSRERPPEPDPNLDAAGEPDHDDWRAELDRRAFGLAAENLPHAAETEEYWRRNPLP